MKKILFALTMLACVVSALPQATRADVSIDFFYNNLSGGNWIEVEGYGYGWQPDVAVSDPNWRPYADGYWAYTDIGWAPLPPRAPGVVYEGQPIGARVDIEYDIGPEYYNFCDVRFIGEPVLRDRIFPPTQNVTYITNTVNVTNITVQNNVVYNHGPDINVVSAYSSRPIQRLTIERQSAGDLSAAAKSGALTRVQGNKLVVAAPPKFAKAPPNGKPPAVKAKVAQPKIERGWTGVQNKAELEQKIKAENPRNIPPPTRAAARQGGSPLPAVGGSPAVGGPKPPVSPGPRGKAGRVLPGATAAPGGGAPSPFERAKPTPGRLHPGITPPPREPGGVSPSPFERDRGKPGARPQPGVSAPPAGTSPAPFDRERLGKPGGTVPPSFRPSPPPPEQGRPPARKLSESPIPRATGGSENQPGRGRGLENQRFGTPPPAGAGENERRGPERRQPPGLRQPGSPPPTG